MPYLVVGAILGIGFGFLFTRKLDERLRGIDRRYPRTWKAYRLVTAVWLAVVGTLAVVYAGLAQLSSALPVQSPPHNSWPHPSTSAPWSPVPAASPSPSPSPSPTVPPAP